MLENTRKSGILFAIKRYALHDGPDIRVTIFLKGCPLSCIWCHNPEGIPFGTDMVSISQKCVGCLECIQKCPQNALKQTTQGVIRNSTCKQCAQCADVCPALAHEVTGTTWESSKVIAEIEKEMLFFQEGKGGVTFSGGEPLAQADFLEELLYMCRDRGIHSTVDTSGFVASSTLLRLMSNIDLFLYDLKHMDNAKHRQLTGVDNTLILENAKMLNKHGASVQFRMPLIPEHNDDEANIHATAQFLTSLQGITSLDLLPYHDTARSKYKKLQISYPGADIPSSRPEQTDTIKNIFESYGLHVRIGG